jgi:hypothetical protein
MKRSTRNIFKIIISLLYILWGIYAPVQAFEAVLAFDIGALISAGVGLMMLLAGIFGLIGLKRLKCKIFGVVIFIIAAVGVVTALPVLNWSSIVSAILAWLFIICV